MRWPRWRIAPPGAKSSSASADPTDIRWAQWLPRQRWYAGRTRTLTSAAVHSVIPLERSQIALVDARYADGSTERYQVLFAYDEMLARVDAEPGVVLPRGVEFRVLDAEQSNTSVVFGEQVILKVFRRVVGGINPDIELTRVLGRAGNPHIAPLLGTFGIVEDGVPFSLAMVSAYAPGAISGWDLATRGSFDGESHRLGEAVASVHATLAAELGTSTATVPVERFRARLVAAVADVPQLESYRAAIEERYASVTGAPVAVARVHGDLHLGQVLRTTRTWLLIDFEGEPGAPLDQRRQQDSPLRDVAGMLRSFDYAGSGSRAEFCAGYASVAGADPRADAEVLAAYELDKAIYEARYEALYRPDWLHIPMRGIGRLLG